jgi:hypothetical protein
MLATATMGLLFIKTESHGGQWDSSFREMGAGLCWAHVVEPRPVGLRQHIAGNCRARIFLGWLQLSPPPVVRLQRDQLHACGARHIVGECMVFAIVAVTPWWESR